MTSLSVTQYNPYNMYQNYGFSYPSFKGVTTATGFVPRDYNAAVLRNPQSDTVSFSVNGQIQAETQKTQGLSNAAKWGVIGTVTVLGLGALAIALTRGKAKPKITDEALSKLNGLVSNGKMDKTYLDIFTETHVNEGKSFVQDVYNKLTKAMGYDKYKPQLNIVDSYQCSKSSTNGVTISLKGFPTKETQVGTIRHELEHFRQNELVYRSFGREAYINAHIEPSITVLKLSDEKCIEKFGKPFKELSTSEIEAYKAKIRSSIESKLQILEDLLKERGVISTSSAEYAEANKYLQAMKEYVTPTAIWGDKPGTFARLKTEAPEQYKLAQDLSKKYYNNALEQGAVKEETNIRNMYKLFIDNVS